MPIPSNEERPNYTDPPGGITAPNRASLGELHRRSKGPFSASDAAEWLAVPVPRARRLLAYLAERGWLARVARGLYVTVPLEAGHPREWREEPLLVAARMFAPCYIGGWTACEHWGLTDQLFNSVWVYALHRVRRREVQLGGTKYRIKTMPAARAFGVVQVWVRGAPVKISDPTRTVVDLLDDPAVGGGVRHVADVLAAYMRGEHADEDKLLAFASRLKNGAVFKRLGYLAESLGVGTARLIDECSRRRTAGLARLDPSVSAPGRIAKRWSLRVNVAVRPGTGA
jgi:predicted transcriptional regulator of viral defense system